jgi:aminopeptidase
MLRITRQTSKYSGIIYPVKQSDKSPETELSSLLPASILKKLYTAGKPLQPGQSRILYNEKIQQQEYEQIACVNISLPKKLPKYEYVDTEKEHIRAAVSKAVKSFKGSNLDVVKIDPSFFDLETVSEAVKLASFEYKTKEAAKFPKFTGLDGAGSIYGEAQNFARFLMEAPANLMTPQIFAETVQAKVKTWNLGDKVEVIVRDEAWIKSKNMGAFLSVSQGGGVPPVLLEVHVNKPKNDENAVPEICMVGKGVTFDTGGISIKPSAGMDAMRADMGGAATMVSATLGAAKLDKSGKYYVCLTPLCENMPSGSATKPGDVVTACNGKTIQVDNTDAEGRMILADTLVYADRDLKAKRIVDAATLTGAMMVALGAGASGVFTRSQDIYDKLFDAAWHTGDRVWQMPMFNLYLEQMKKSPTADLNNIGGGGRGGGACTAAAFLGEFVENSEWAHVDIAGVMDNKSEVAYLSAGMSGRPTRTFLKFLHDINHDQVEGDAGLLRTN